MSKIDAVGVASSDFTKTVKFYSLLGFEFPKFKSEEDHLEAIHKDGDTRLMIDSVKLLTNILGEKPRPGNTSAFAILYKSPDEVNKAASSVSSAGFKITKEPWDAFWGQRYAIVEDPDGYRVDLFAALPYKK